MVTIPEGAKVLVMEGEEVGVGEDILEINTGIKMLEVSEIFKGLSSTDRAKLKEQLPGMKVAANEVIYETKGLFSKKIILPINGEIIKVDEFDNLYFREGGEKRKKINCPVEAKVVKKEGRVLELEFRAEEYEGRGVNEGKAWGIMGLGYIGKMTDLSFKEADKIVLTEGLHQSWLVKAEVVGVKGVVVIEDKEKENEKIESKLPILAVEKNEWWELREKIATVKKAMINAANNRLLLVV